MESGNNANITTKKLIINKVLTKKFLTKKMITIFVSNTNNNEKENDYDRKSI